MSIYPKSTSPVTPQVLRAANDRAERWRVRYMAARDEVEALKREAGR
jgi:hypothetical protein